MVRSILAARVVALLSCTACLNGCGTSPTTFYDVVEPSVHLDFYFTVIGMEPKGVAAVVAEVLDSNGGIVDESRGWPDGELDVHSHPGQTDFWSVVDGHVRCLRWRISTTSAPAAPRSEPIAARIHASLQTRLGERYVRYSGEGCLNAL